MPAAFAVKPHYAVTGSNAAPEKWCDDKRVGRFSALRVTRTALSRLPRLAGRGPAQASHVLPTAFVAKKGGDKMVPMRGLYRRPQVGCPTRQASKPACRHCLAHVIETAFARKGASGGDEVRRVTFHLQ